MTQLTEQLLHQALQLSQDEREELADQLYLSLHAPAEPPAEVEAAWNQEIARRIGEVETGSVTLVAAEQVHGDVRKILNGG